MIIITIYVEICPARALHMPWQGGQRVDRYE